MEDNQDESICRICLKEGSAGICTMANCPLFNNHDQEICRICLKKGAGFGAMTKCTPLFNGWSIGVTLKKLFPEMKLNYYTLNPVICNNCLRELESAHMFKSKCLSTETKIKQYIRKSNCNPSQVNLFDVSKMVAADLKNPASTCVIEEDPLRLDEENFEFRPPSPKVRRLPLLKPKPSGKVDKAVKLQTPIMSKKFQVATTSLIANTSQELQYCKLKVMNVNLVPVSSNTESKSDDETLILNEISEVTVNQGAKKNQQPPIIGQKVKVFSTHLSKLQKSANNPTLPVPPLVAIDALSSGALVSEVPRAKSPLQFLPLLKTGVSKVTPTDPTETDTNEQGGSNWIDAQSISDNPYNESGSQAQENIEESPSTSINKTRADDTPARIEDIDIKEEPLDFERNDESTCFSEGETTRTASETSFYDKGFSASEIGINMDVLQCTLPDVDETANNLLPLKSSSIYKSAYKKFIEWCTEQSIVNYSEYVLLAYFSKQATYKKSSTMWSQYSMIKSLLNLKHGIDISKYAKLIAFLKKNNLSYFPKEVRVFTKDQFEQFLCDAPDKLFLGLKVVFIIGIFGACRCEEMAKMSTDDVEDLGSLLFIKIPDSGTRSRSFAVVGDNYINICRKYMSLRPQNMQERRFFVKYQKGKCHRNVMGIHKIGDIPKEIARYLNLPNWKEYTGHCFRRTSSVLLIDKDYITYLKCREDKKSRGAANQQLQGSLNIKKEVKDTSV